MAGQSLTGPEYVQAANEAYAARQAALAAGTSTPPPPPPPPTDVTATGSGGPSFTPENIRDVQAAMGPSTGSPPPAPGNIQGVQAGLNGGTENVLPVQTIVARPPPVPEDTSTDGAVYAPGSDRDGRTPLYARHSGAGGVFAQYIQGATPKYARNNGHGRETGMRDTMARMFVRVDADEWDIFLRSIGDPRVVTLVKTLAGDPGAPRLEGRSVIDTGYMDFFLESAQHSLQEAMQVTPTVGGDYVGFAFGQAPPVWSYQGKLLNTVQDDQASNMLRLYLEVLRATRLAQRQKAVTLKYGSFLVSGAMTNYQEVHQSQNENVVAFSFQLLVKRVRFVNTTKWWTPTQVNGVFAADPYDVPYDGRPRQERAATTTTAATSPMTMSASDGHVTVTSALAPEGTPPEADARTAQAPITAPPPTTPTQPDPTPEQAAASQAALAARPEPAAPAPVPAPPSAPVAQSRRTSGRSPAPSQLPGARAPAPQSVAFDATRVPGTTFLGGTTTVLAHRPSVFDRPEASTSGVQPDQDVRPVFGNTVSRNGMRVTVLPSTRPDPLAHLFE